MLGLEGCAGIGKPQGGGVEASFDVVVVGGGTARGKHPCY